MTEQIWIDHPETDQCNNCGHSYFVHYIVSGEDLKVFCEVRGCKCHEYEQRKENDGSNH